ncbi:MAG: hypothetical protein IPH68_01365 [Chitinophagaceae bacterium]|nr:hypothetical protein [Chitinophagaceae bacterium]
MLVLYKKTDVDSVAVVSITNDSAYTFPLTNYQSTLGETRIAGDNNQVSEVTRQSDEKVLYKLKIDENVLRRRNITAQPTEYMKKVMGEYKDTAAVNKAITAAQPPKKDDDFFQTEFANEKKDSSTAGKDVAVPTAGYDVLKTIKKFRYKPPKFSADYGSDGLSSGSNVLINRYQPYGGGSGPIMLNSGSVLNGLIRLGTAELMEDVRITGGFRIGSNLKDNEWMMSYQNYKRRIDWGATYYRNVVSYDFGLLDSTGNQVNSPGKIFTNLYQVNVSYPFDATKSIRLSTGIRSDNAVIVSNVNRQFLLGTPNQRTLYSTTHLEYVYDNSLNPAMNIWNGLRYKFLLTGTGRSTKYSLLMGPTPLILVLMPATTTPFTAILSGPEELQVISAGATRK